MDGISPEHVAVLRKYCSNINKDVSNPKYRRVRLGNDRFAPIWANTNAHQLLTIAGWRTDVEDGFIVLPAEVTADAMTMMLEEYPQPVVAAAAVVAPKLQPIKSKRAPLTDQERQEKKQKVINDERQKIVDTLRIEKERKRLLKVAIEADRAQVATVESRASVQNRTTFGGRIARYADIGVDLNKGS